MGTPPFVTFWPEGQQNLSRSCSSSVRVCSVTGVVYFTPEGWVGRPLQGGNSHGQGRFFPLNSPVKYLPGFLLFLCLCQFRYKKRVYKQSNLDEKQRAKLHTNVSERWPSRRHSGR